MKNPNLMVSSFMNSKKTQLVRCKSCFRFLLENFCLGFFCLGLFWLVLWTCTQFLYQQGYVITKQEWLEMMQEVAQQAQTQSLDSVDIPKGIEMIQFIDDRVTFSSYDLFKEIPSSFFYQNEGMLGSYSYQKFFYNQSTLVLLTQFPQYFSNFSIQTDLKGWYLCILLSGSILISWYMARSSEKILLRQLSLLQDQLTSSTPPMHYQIQEFLDLAMILFSSTTTTQDVHLFKSEQGNELFPSSFKRFFKLKHPTLTKSTQPVNPCNTKKQLRFSHPHWISINLHDFMHQTAQDFQNLADQHDIILHCQSCRETVYVFTPLFQKTIQSLVLQTILHSPVQSHVKLFAQFNQNSWQIKITDQSMSRSHYTQDDFLPLAKQLIRQAQGTLLIQPTADQLGNETILQFSTFYPTVL